MMVKDSAVNAVRVRIAQKDKVNKVRYEIMLPVNLNDGSPQPPELLLRTIKEIVQQMGGCSFEPGIIEGTWVHDGKVFKDLNSRVTADVDFTPANLQFFENLKLALEARFQQHSIYITRHPIEVI